MDEKEGRKGERKARIRRRRGWIRTWDPKAKKRNDAGVILTGARINMNLGWNEPCLDKGFWILEKT